MKITTTTFWLFALFGGLFAGSFHTIPMDGNNAFTSDETFSTSTAGYSAYVTWDDQYLYLAYTGDHLASDNDTTRVYTNLFWYIDTDPHPTNPKTGNGTDKAGTVWTQIMLHQPFWFDEQSWVLPFYADYNIKAQYQNADSTYYKMGPYNSDDQVWEATNYDTSLANLNRVDGYWEMKISLADIGNPTEINILAYAVSTEWKSDIYYSSIGEPQRDVGGSYASWPSSSLRGGDGDKGPDGHLDHWIHLHLQDAITPDQENDPPVTDVIPNQTINDGEVFTVINLNDYVFDDITPDSIINWTSFGSTNITISIDANHMASISYPGSWIGSDTATFVAEDQNAKKDSSSVIFRVNGIPVAQNDTSAALEDNSVSINLISNDSDPDISDSLSIQSILNTVHGSVVIDTDSMVTYTPNQDFFGSDSFQYILTDGVGGTDTAFVFIDVSPINDPPEIVGLPDVVTLEINDSITYYMADYAQDVDTPDSLLTWSFEVSDIAISYDYDEVLDSLTIYSHDIPGEYYLFATLTDDSNATDKDTITVQVNDPSGIISLISPVPTKFIVNQNYPNPFNPTTRIRFGLAKSTPVRISIFNAVGQKVYEENHNILSAGYHEFNLNAENLAAGIYIYRIQAGNEMVSKKMILLK